MNLIPSNNKFIGDVMIRSILFSFLFIFITSDIYASRVYVEPPSDPTFSHVPVISDEQMELCVKVYNESTWLSEELNYSHVNVYSEREVNEYNRKANDVNSMNEWFNRNCAGKQSRSACEAAQKLNREKGLPVQPCR